MLARLKSWLGLDFYTSPLDLFLAQLNAPRRHLTKAEQQEVDKHRRLADARDKPIAPRQKPAHWDAF